jgi:SAM-dependent methyltransferase
MKPYILELFIESAKERTRTPAWIIRLYLSLFEPPLGKTLRLDLVRAVLRQSKFDLRGKRVLDLGCGIGDLAFILAERGAQVVGIDIDAEKMERANNIARKWGFAPDTLHFIAGDATRVGEMNLGQFDAIFCIALLEHVHDDVGLLRQIQRMLAPDGIFVLEVPSATRKTIPEVEAEDGHVRPGYVFEEMPALLEKTGFHLVATRTMDTLGLRYRWCASSRILPGRTARGQLFALFSLIFIPLIRLTSALVKRPGAELCFLALKAEGCGGRTRESSKEDFAFP